MMCGLKLTFQSNFFLRGRSHFETVCLAPAPVLFYKISLALLECMTLQASSRPFKLTILKDPILLAPHQTLLDLSLCIIHHTVVKSMVFV